jgi:hypothetical protein
MIDDAALLLAIACENAVKLWDEDSKFALSYQAFPLYGNFR